MSQIQIKVKVDETDGGYGYTYAYTGQKRTTPDTRGTGDVYMLTPGEAAILRAGGTVKGFNDVEFVADPTPEPAPAPAPTRSKFLGIF